MTEAKKDFNQWNIYKTRAAFQLSWSAEKKTIFVNMAKAIEARKYDWKDKIVLALAITDVLKILGGIEREKKNRKSVDKKGGIIYGLQSPVKILHDKGKGTDKEGQHISALQLIRGQNDNTYFINAYVKTPEGLKSANISLTDEEFLGLDIYLRAALVKMMGIN